ncbi:outer membrane protein assembly factor BamA [[Haemophilus] ducreyi]|uniref:outer membrane protein assembly factor BamA n=1 Tax=Haemophilus ducreyi TaxID=730 RepID=UPI0007CDA59E|nr:outer membrane protein assembly factor BamA [[Haemophilus] ducreyi]ANF62497.1 outer membrane protein assembly factor BamA [[Haemophilus] ducreyi]ANF67625.1 outer membrane protein assembly factor BamA [[Haemophilus] ducreyi]ANF68501.1 outer membrane protein assembly factor BamA [[Haemophilus] ducreyi]
MKKLLLSSLLVANGVIAAPFVVKDIRIDGVQTETGNAIIASLPVKVGQTATDGDVTNIVKQLFSQNRFENVSAAREGQTLVIKVAERPLINNLTIKGNNAIPKNALEQNLKANLIVAGEVYDKAKLEAFKQALVDHYHTMGRYQADIQTITTPNNNGSINVELNITEGELAYVKKINFEGNNAFSHDELIKELEIKPNAPWWNIFESSKFQQQEYNKDIEILHDFYMDHGYAKFTLKDTDVKFNENKTEVDLTYKINEGSQYNISEMRIIGDTQKLDNELNQLLTHFKAGQLFRKTELSIIEEQIKQILGDRGYGSAKVDLYPKFNEENHTVQINFIVDAGRRIYVRKIRFEGNDVTADSTLRREMRQQEGSWLSTSAVSLAKSRLERTGFYEAVEMSMPTVKNTDDQVDIIYKIKERNTGSINFGVGYGSESGLSYNAGITQDNFLGMGSSLGLNGSRNTHSTNVNLSYTEPYFTKDGVSLGGNIFYEDYDNSGNKASAAYKRKTYGASGTLGFPVDENNSYYIGLGYTHDKLRNVEREYTREKYVNSMKFPINPQNSHYDRIQSADFDLSFGWNYNNLNRGYFPTKGSSANIGGKLTLPGSDNKYYRVNTDFSSYIPLDGEHKWVVATKGGVAYTNSFGGKEVPFYQLYSAGGMGSLRGFAGGSIGPKAIYYRKDGFKAPSQDVIGGNAMVNASLELIIPAPFISDKYQHNVRTSVFVDAATVWNTKWKQSKADYPNLPDFGDYKRVRASVGIALQWQSPIGPLSFSYAKPIKKYAGDEIEQFQFTVGSTF